MKPFDCYPNGAHELVRKPLPGDNCRRGYGLEFMKMMHQTKCAYCGVDFTLSFEAWLTVALDHVIPQNVCRDLKIPKEFVLDCANLVLSCAGCNTFCNRYKPPDGMKELVEFKRSGFTPEAFFNLRDVIFTDRKGKIAVRRGDEEKFFREHVPQIASL